MDRLPERLAEKLGHQRVRGSTKMTHKGIDLVRCANALQFLSHPLHFSLCDSLRGEGCSHIRKHS